MACLAHRLLTDDGVEQGVAVVRGLLDTTPCAPAVTGRAGRGTPGRPRRPQRRRVVRPVRPSCPLVSCAGVLLAWGLVAHNSGAGWVQAVGDLLAGILAVGLLAPGAAVARGPGSTLVARPDRRHRRAPGRAHWRTPPPGCGSRPSSRRAPSPSSGRTADAGGGGSASTGTGRRRRSPCSPVRRGVHDRRRARGRLAPPPSACCGGADRRRRPCPAPCTSGPRLGRAPARCPAGARSTPAAGGRRSTPAVQIGEPRGVRPYRPGDHRRWVHWPATAHSGELMVREMEGPTAEPVTLEVHLPADADAAERMAERAMARSSRSSTGGARCSSPPPRTTGPRSGGGRPPQRRPAPGPRRGRAGGAGRRHAHVGPAAARNAP